MNLLTAPWIPVSSADMPGITLQTLLCQENPELAIRFHRDDIELATLQMLVCLVQVLFLPDNKHTLRERLAKPLTEQEFQAGIAPFVDMFDLRHETHPFMQTRGVSAKDATPVQKLFAGLPEGNNHALFNDAGEITAVPAAWAAIALFNQAVNCPSFGGGFKGGLRGEAPLTTLIRGNSLRETVWFNVLNREYLTASLPHLENIKEDLPVWINPIAEKSTIHAHQIGLLRGLFWQPAKVELLWNEAGQCIGFKKEKFNYTVDGFWQHPHSPFIVKPKQNKKFYLSFRRSEPAWTYLNELLVHKLTDKQGHVPALVISHFQEVFHHRTLHLIVGGYKNKQASIIQRRHELLSLASGWDENMQNLEQLINYAMDIKGKLSWTLREFGKKANLPKLDLSANAEARFYLDSEDFIYSRLQQVDWNELIPEKQRFFDRLASLATRIFEEVTQPYQNLTEPKMLKALAESERLLRRALNKLNPASATKEAETA
ncbi:MAG: type I-E CRISPR-associated protein Cse1/CasA [Gammaproteobacteria bacterium]